jgi:hypothetical protein
VHREHQRAGAEAYLEYVTVPLPRLPDEVEKASPANTVEEAQRSGAGGMHGHLDVRAFCEDLGRGGFVLRRRGDGMAVRLILFGHETAVRIDIRALHCN